MTHTPKTDFALVGEMYRIAECKHEWIEQTTETYFDRYCPKCGGRQYFSLTAKFPEATKP